MKVTDVRIFRKEPVEGSPFLATASVVFDDSFVVYGIRLFNKEGKRYVTMPSKKIRDNWVDVCHPINSETRTLIEEAVFEAYDKPEEAAE